VQRWQKTRRDPGAERVWRSSTGDVAIRIDLVFLLPIVRAAAAGGILNLLSRRLPPEAAADEAAEDTPNR
jgi:hypothetical protein